MSLSYPHTVRIDKPTFSADGGGGQTVSSWATVYSGRADVQDSQALDPLAETGLQEQMRVTVYLPETEDLSGIEEGDRLTWTDYSVQGEVQALSRLDNGFTATLE